MYCLAQQFLELARVRAFDRQAVPLGKRAELAHSRIVASRRKLQAQNAIRGAHEKRAHGVQTEDALDAPRHSSTSSRSISPSMGLTAVTTTFTWPPARSRRPWRRPTQP